MAICPDLSKIESYADCDDPVDKPPTEYGGPAEELNGDPDGTPI